MGKQEYKAVLVGQRFSHEDNVWEKRGDELGAQLIDRHGCVSFMGGRRCFHQFEDGDLVTVL